MSETLENFAKNPDEDFTRNRKLSFENVINLLLSIGGNSIYNELLEYFKFDISMASTSAFVDMVDRHDISDDAIVISDRGYKNYNTIAHIQGNGVSI